MVVAAPDMTLEQRDHALAIWNARVKLFGDPKAARRITELYAGSRSHDQVLERRVLFVGLPA